METENRTIRASSHRARLMKGVMWRNFVAALVAKACHNMAWLLKPRHMPKHPIGNLRRNGHCSSFGRRISS